MPFEDIQPVRTHLPRDPVCGTFYTQSGNKKSSFEIVIRSEMMTRLGLAVGDSVALAIGNGTDAGLIQVRKNLTGYKIMYRSKDGTGRFKVSTAAVPSLKFIDVLIAITPLNHQAFGSTLTIDISDFLQK